MARDWKTPKRAWYHIKNVQIGSQHLDASKHEMQKQFLLLSSNYHCLEYLKVIVGADYLLQAIPCPMQWIALRSVEVHLTIGFEGKVVSDGGLGSGYLKCLLFV